MLKLGKIWNDQVSNRKKNDNNKKPTQKQLHLTFGKYKIAKKLKEKNLKEQKVHYLGSKLSFYWKSAFENTVVEITAHLFGKLGTH